jgi:predicted sugar kinase
VDLGIIILLSSGPRVRGLFGPNTTLVLGLMSASALLYSLNTWLPDLMRRNGFGQTASLAFLMFSNGGGFLERSSVLARSIGSALSRRLPRAS